MENTPRRTSSRRGDRERVFQCMDRYAPRQRRQFGRGGRCCVERLLIVWPPLAARPGTNGGEATAPGVGVTRSGRALGGQDQQVEDPQLRELVTAPGEI